MKTVVIAGVDNTAFFAADLLNPLEQKLVGFAVTMESAWNARDEDGRMVDELDDMPIMPLEMLAGYDPDCVVLAAAREEDDKRLRRALVLMDYRGEVVSLYEGSCSFSPRTAVLRKLAWRLEDLGVPGAAADAGCGHGDLSWQMNALMPARRLYLFDTFSGTDERDAARDRELGFSEARAGEGAFTAREREHVEQMLLGRMPEPSQVTIRQGWFPDTVEGLEGEVFALVHIDFGLYAPTLAALEFFYPRLAPGGVLVLPGFEDGRSQAVRSAVMDFEAARGILPLAFLCDMDGTAVITRGSGSA